MEAHDEVSMVFLATKHESLAAPPAPYPNILNLTDQTLPLSLGVWLQGLVGFHSADITWRGVSN